MNVFFRHWPVPPKMSRGAYRRYRCTLLCHVIVSAVYAVGAVLMWDHANFIGHSLMVVIGCLFAPGADVIENLLVSYEAYVKGGLW